MELSTQRHCQLSSLFKQSSIIKGFGCLTFDKIIVKDKKFLTYLLIQEITFNFPRIAELRVPRTTLMAWTKANRIFGPVPLSLLIYSPDGVHAKRLSYSWEGEYDWKGEDSVVPNTGFVKLELPE